MRSAAALQRLSLPDWLSAKLTQRVYLSRLGQGRRRVWRIDAVLYLGGYGTALIMAAWALSFALEQHGPGLALNLLGAGAGLGAQWLAHKPAWRRQASCLLFFSTLACIAVCCCLFDLPVAGYPRTTHLYLLPLAVVAYLLFEEWRPGLGLALGALSLLLFLVFASTDLGWRTQWAQPPGLLRWGAWFNGFAAMGGLALALAGAQARLREHGPLVLDLRHALARGELRILLQAQVNRDGETVGAEVLLRWQHPRLGLLAAHEFIDQAERSGLIAPIGDWVLHEACALLAAWRADPDLRRLTLAINISAAQLHGPDFVERVQDALLHHGAPPGALLLEINESLLACDRAAAVVEKLHALAALGLACSLGEFGSRISSLSHLQQLPLSDLKMQAAFVRELDSNPRSASITEAVLSMGRRLNLRVVAEGVETPAQWALLCTQGCEYFQGHLFGPPLAARDFSAHLLT